MDADKDRVLGLFTDVRTGLDIRDLVLAHGAPGLIVQRAFVRPGQHAWHAEQPGQVARLAHDRQVNLLLGHAVWADSAAVKPAVPGIQYQRVRALLRGKHAGPAHRMQLIGDQQP